MDENRYETLIDDLHEERRDKRSSVVKWVIRSALVITTLILFGLANVKMANPSGYGFEQVGQVQIYFFIVIPGILVVGGFVIWRLDLPYKSLDRNPGQRAQKLISKIKNVDREIAYLHKNSWHPEKVRKLITSRSLLCKKLEQCVERNGLEIDLHQITSDNHLPRL